MPTDEQPATHFYGYYISFDATGVEPVDHVLKAVADAGRGSHHTQDWKELGLEEEIQRAAGRAAEAFRARDAEVQALREALESIHYRATRWEVLPTVEAHQSVLQDIGEDALAALAGGEAGEAE